MKLASEGAHNLVSKMERCHTEEVPTDMERTHLIVKPGGSCLWRGVVCHLIGKDRQIAT